MKEIKVEHLARVEGHGAITVEVDGRKVKDVKFEVLEGPRLFETITLGKTPAENLSVVPRICAICTLSHRYASLRGLEKCLDIKIPEKTHWMRELMLAGEAIESHSLHVYLLALPDLLGYPNAVAMVTKYADSVVQGLTLKKFGNSIMELCSARATHGENPIIGGFGKFPTNEKLYAIADQAKTLIPYAEGVIDILGNMQYPTFFEKETVFACCNPPDNQYGLVSDEIILSDGKKFSCEDYTKITNERVVPHSFAKRSLYKNSPFSVGSLARVNNLGDRLQERAGDAYEKYKNARWKKNPVYNNLAQAIELLYALEQVPVYVEKLVELKDPPIVKPKRQSGKGTGAVEAPRGTLYHSYEVKDGRMAKVDIITPTAQNYEDIEKYLRLAAEYMVSEGRKDDDVRFQLEVIARAYDPCISCSAHLVKLVRK
ncbi:MAG: Ni/Fe hydrogenase subunit alpha [Thermoplasmata archaeon]|nr:Ni/Fe hydrogenase subunit alpha [Thermoplasmata archaeon]